MKPRRLTCVECGEELDIPDGADPYDAARDARWGICDGKGKDSFKYRCPPCKRAVELLSELRHVERNLAVLNGSVVRFERWRDRIDAELDRLERARNGEPELPLDHGLPDEPHRLVLAVRRPRLRHQRSMGPPRPKEAAMSSVVVTFVDPADNADKPLVYEVRGRYVGVSIGDFKVLFRGDSIDESVDLAQSVLRKTLDAIHESWPQ